MIHYTLKCVFAYVAKIEPYTIIENTIFWYFNTRSLRWCCWCRQCSCCTIICWWVLGAHRIGAGELRRHAYCVHQLHTVCKEQSILQRKYVCISPRWQKTFAGSTIAATRACRLQSAHCHKHLAAAPLTAMDIWSRSSTFQQHCAAAGIQAPKRTRLHKEYIYIYI